ncbi:Ribonuclease 3 [sediment metagenome]|uniref:ribonuclease III n=1 Tax=sediment metagenome TaxID=749907 RepID=D9PK52_9ZZZZ
MKIEEKEKKIFSLEEFEKKIGLSFKNKSLIELAFIHRSYLNENRGEVKEHNERIEFLGDAVLELVTTEMLYKKFPEMKEGEMTALRSALVNTDSLSKQASRLEMENFLKMSKGEASSNKGRWHILANTFESVIGAIYLDFGYEQSKKFLEINLFPYLDEILDNELHRDPKSYFQELSQERKKITPDYKIIGEDGPEHDREYIMAVYIGDEFVAEGRGSSKKNAEIDAAKNALKIKK